MSLASSSALVVVMVGLPARGKTFTARKLARYLRWQGRNARVFNVGNYRRDRLGAHQPASFFDPSNERGAAARKAVAVAALDDLLSWLGSSGDVAIYDATNSTRERRAWVRRRCERAGSRVLFVETICDDDSIIESNIKETKVSSPDYRQMDSAAAVEDFRRRIELYERVYETVDEEQASYIKLINAGDKVVVNRVHGYLASRLVTFLMNLRITPRTIWLTRHGQSMFNKEQRIGGNSPLSAVGERYSHALAEFVVRSSASELLVWTSTLRRTHQTVAHLPQESRAWRSLDEIEAGRFDSWTYAEIEHAYPEEFRARAHDKLAYRYPRGESYLDVIARLDPLIIEIERQRRPMLIVAHNAVIRTLYGYFTELPAREIPHLPIPLHTVIELSPRAYGLSESRYALLPGEATES